MWWVVGVGVLCICGALWWLVFHVGWRDEPGRHAFGYVDEVSRDEEEPVTEVLPVVRDSEFYDPSFYRLGRAVRRWQEYQ